MLTYLESDAVLRLSGGGVIYLQRVYKPPLLVWQFGSLGSVAMITGPSESELGQLVIFLLIAF